MNEARSHTVNPWTQIRADAAKLCAAVLAHLPDTRDKDRMSQANFNSLHFAAQTMQSAMTYFQFLEKEWDITMGAGEKKVSESEADFAVYCMFEIENADGIEAKEKRLGQPYSYLAGLAHGRREMARAAIKWIRDGRVPRGLD